GLIMAHSDDNGLVLPPKLAPIQVVLVPIMKGNGMEPEMLAMADKIVKLLKEKGVSVKFDDRDTHKPGWKFAEYELKGVPIRIALGPRDVEQGTVEIARRDTLSKETVSAEGIENRIVDLLEEIQKNIYNKAVKFREENTTDVNSYAEFKEVLETKGGFVRAHWDGTDETEAKIKEETKATIRCITMDENLENGKCIYSGKDSTRRVVFAKAY
ncbi:MAG: proline--tRNA ligase anticodon binding domain-containing protein, partial [Cyclobacteriaceae bacterium]